MPHIFTMMQMDPNKNLQHESCTPPKSLQLWIIKFSQKKLGSQVMIFGTRVPKTFNLEKFCPSLGRILTYLHGNFHLVPLGISKFISNMDSIACYKISKMSKNSPKSFLSRENRREEVGIFSLFVQVISMKNQVENQTYAGYFLLYRS